MNEFRNILNDIKNKKYIESYVVFLASLGVLIASFINLSQSTLNQVVLAILSILLYASIVERRSYSKLLERGNIDGIAAFRINRDKMPSLSEHIGNARKEISILAVQHSALIHQYLGLVQQKAESGCQIKLLMMAAMDENGNLNPNVKALESHLTYSEVLSQLESNATTFKTWLDSLSVRSRKQVEIRTYVEHPIGSYLFIDKDEPDGYVQVEIFLYGVHVNDMPHYVVTRRDSHRFFQIHLDSFNKLWNKSQPLLSPEKTKSKKKSTA